MIFKDLGLSDGVLKAIQNIGFITPTPIQEVIIPKLLKGKKDFVGLAQTGTGKTAAYGLPMVNLISFSETYVQGLVVCPTRELCLQVTKDIQLFSSSYNQANIVPVYGGANISMQIKAIQRGAQIIVATPGRLVDLINRKKVNLSQVKIAVLDEADEMLNMGFKQDINLILKQTPKDKNVWLFSATMPKAVEQIAKKYMQAPETIVIGKQNEAGKDIKHAYFQLNERDRYDAVKRYIDMHREFFGLIFCRTKRNTQNIAEKLINDGYNVGAIHGDLSQNQRDSVMQQFRSRNLKILVATDVAARGIDVPEITHVIHYMLPDEIENYTHRSGRTGRAGKSGISLAIINTKESRKVRDIEKHLSIQFKKLEVPSLNEVSSARIDHFVQKIANTKVKEKYAAANITEVLAQFENISKEDLISRWLSIEMTQLNKSSHSLKPMNGANGAKNKQAAFQTEYNRGNKRFNDSPKDVIYISLGKKDGLNKGGVVRTLCDKAGIDSVSVGRIDIKDSFTFVDIDQGIGKVLLKKLHSFSYEGKAGKIELKSENKKNTGGRIKKNNFSGNKYNHRKSNQYVLQN